MYSRNSTVAYRIFCMHMCTQFPLQGCAVPTNVLTEFHCCLPHFLHAHVHTVSLQGCAVPTNVLTEFHCCLPHFLHAHVHTVSLQGCAVPINVLIEFHCCLLHLLHAHVHTGHPPRVCCSTAPLAAVKRCWPRPLPTSASPTSSPSRVLSC